MVANLPFTPSPLVRANAAFIFWTTKFWRAELTAGYNCLWRIVYGKLNTLSAYGNLGRHKCSRADIQLHNLHRYIFTRHSQGWHLSAILALVVETTVDLVMFRINLTWACADCHHDEKSKCFKISPNRFYVNIYNGNGAWKSRKSWHTKCETFIDGLRWELTNYLRRSYCCPEEWSPLLHPRTNQWNCRSHFRYS